METYHSLDAFSAQAATLTGPLTLTLGTFDGVHLGHRALLEQTVAKASDAGGSSVALTFTTHPLQVLRPNEQPKAICTLDHKLVLFEELGIDAVIMLDFTEEFSRQAPKEFLQTMRDAVPFESIVLGYDARFGKDREGTPEVMQELAPKMGFEAEYVSQVFVSGEPVSSTAIRAAIESGDLITASIMLGRPYSIMGDVIHGKSKGKALGYPTANIDISGLCLPPYGVYSVTVLRGVNGYHGVANLGVAPMMRDDPKPVLEAFLFDFVGTLYGLRVEIRLHQYIRAEGRFSDILSLKQQIDRDIAVAKKSFI